MKTRLRISHSKEDDPRAAAHADRLSHETSASDRFGDIFSMQHTHGNAYMQRYFKALAGGKLAPNFISRDTPKKSGDTPKPKTTALDPHDMRTLIFMKITDQHGKPIPGSSQRRGHGTSSRY